MKKSTTLMTTGMIAFVFLLIAGCNYQTIKTITVSTKTPQPMNTVPIPSPTDKPGHSQFLPFISSNPSSPEGQTAPDATATEMSPTATSTPGDPPTPTLFWPTPVSKTFATPYVRPNGAHGQDLPPEKWQEWPVIPVVSDRARDIYRAGIAAGRDPQHFSKVGDCQNIRQYFLGMFDTPGTFELGETYKNLQKAIDNFLGSWHRLSEAVHTGFNVASVLTPLYANPQNCKPGETPLACEIRIWNPSIVIISMETWTAGRPVQAYENYLRQIVEYAISHNVLPIVATKADNLEGDYAINQIVARVAADYDIPMWNFWAASYPLPDHGLLEDGFHLTNGPNFFEKPENLQVAWPVRNLTALQTIDAVWNKVK